MDRRAATALDSAPPRPARASAAPGAPAPGTLRFSGAARQLVEWAAGHRVVALGLAGLVLWAVQLPFIGHPGNGTAIGYDMHAYWLAGHNVREGTRLYWESDIATFAAFKYPPIFAQIAVLFSLLPEPAVDAAWRVLGICCWRYLSGSWRMAIVWMICSETYYELLLGNVTLQLGAVALLAVRGDRRGIYLLPWFAALKFGPALLYPYLWFCAPQARRPLVVGTAIFAAACLVSFIVAPGLWFEYLGTFGWESSSKMAGLGIFAIVPGHGGLDFAARFALGLAVTLVAIRIRRDWLAFLAAIATCPIFAISRLAPMVGVWPLARERCRPVIADLRRRAALVAGLPLRRRTETRRALE